MINLYDYQDLKYLEFHKKILNNDNICIIGVRVPTLRKIAKEMVINNNLEYLYKNKKYYEEIMIHGLILGYLKLPFNELLEKLDEFIPLVDNWAICDTVCSNLKIFKKNLDEGFIYINKLLKSNDEFTVRFGLVLLLDYYINDEYIDEILDICVNICNDKYYILMANAWLLSICYIKYKDKTLNLLNNYLLDYTLKKKTIYKICDSNRVLKKDKIFLKSMI